jgi:Ca-activated chloride channel family protein
MHSPFNIHRVALAFACCALALAAEENEPVTIEAALGNPVMLAGAKGPNYLRVAVTGNSLPEKTPRVPLNVAIVIDRSGSMQGEKMEAAKRAAKSAIERLRPNDIVSVVAYETSVNIVQPATRIDENPQKASATKEQIMSAIGTITASGNTALFAGVSMGAGELRKELRSGRINRIVLLSDGLANVGPSSPGELSELGTSLGKEGICVTTLGLGLDYNEDLMSKLASASDGNHMFIDSVEALDRAYAMEFGDAMTVVARNIRVKIQCDSAVRPVRVLGREAVIDGAGVLVNLGDISSGRTKYALVEFDMPVGDSGQSKKAADVDVSIVPAFPYAVSTSSLESSLSGARAAKTDTPTRIPWGGDVTYRKEVTFRYTDSNDEVERSINKPVMVAAVQQIAADQNELAMRLRDSGRIEEARQTLLDNGRFLQDNSTRYRNEQLRKDAETNNFGANNLDAEKWKYNRKLQKEYQVGTKKQSVILEKSISR